MIDNDAQPPGDEMHHSDHLRDEHERLGVNSEMVRRLDAWALAKATESGGRLHAFEPGHTNYPAKIHKHHEGDPKDHTMVDIFASMAEPAYAMMSNTVEALEREHRTVSDMLERARNGDNFALVFPHDDLIDVALGLGAFYSKMDQIGCPDNLRTGIVINAMIERLGIELDGSYVPTIDALGIGAHDIWQTIPKTESGRKHMGRHAADERLEDVARFRRTFLEVGIAEKMDFHNYRVRRQIAARLEDENTGTILSVAAPGSEVRSIAGYPSTYQIRRANSRTGEMLMAGRTYVVPIATSYTRGWRPFFEVAAVPRQLTHKEEIHDVMAEISVAMNRLTPDEVIYEYEEAA